MRIGILTGGGDCPGLNPAIRGAVFRALDYGDECVGIVQGWQGLLSCETEPLDLARVDDIIDRGGTILGTSRTNPFKDPALVQQTIANIAALGLDAVIAIGGDDTLGVAAKLAAMGVKVVGVPKTMDNDLSGTDSTFGFDTSVNVALDASRRLKDTALSHRRIIVLEVMGRYAGWVALYTGIGSGADYTLIPEVPVDWDAMVQQVMTAYKRKKYAFIVVSEGVQVTPATSESLDDFGHMLLQNRGVGPEVARILEEKTGVSTRSATIGHIQRGGSPTLFDRILGSRVGVKAVEMIHDGEFGKMAALRGTEIIAIPLTEAVGKLKTVSQEWVDLLKVFSK
ncbi:6-phosphofructokinase [Candidatus Cryosericum hinesii]|uniref:Pyrophosphate--fructose 6-phosphate 1-phosphotransferase n=1 Tax=Candidatus Cryosericum hinesii TaxID=2290915 RepID=A0A398DC84_9BACT|nr:ATP-dependent 6-phosphofructokinase [Candidatus Cryosericum hinesii]RIE08645.1 6-phosphofructokinase [Candidatus Cryosericum hinesii]RIE12515.1 6-phosphofructokinase [Candidatus Cryosericum hinesii]RIE12725.1 6-phosphofructokinase [Candidatus Cryosericum hinesii]